MCGRVDIVPYDDRWPERFEAERAVLRRVFAGIDAEIEHVGSTAVPGPCAKPVIDIMAGVSNLAEVEKLFPVRRGSTGPNTLRPRDHSSSRYSSPR